MSNKSAIICVVMLLLMLLPLLSQEKAVNAILMQSTSYLLLSDAVQSWNAAASFDVLSKTGSIIKGKEIITFKLDYEIFILNGSRVLVGKPIVFKDGRLYIPVETAGLIRAWFLDRENEQKTRGRVAVIVIDAGHGGKDPGAIGDHGTFKLAEKDVTLAIAKKLYELLRNNFPDKKILLTRSDDSYKTLEERVQLANDHTLALNEAIIYVSIHANASFNANAKGFEVWYLDPDYQRTVITDTTAVTYDKDVLPVINSMLQEEYIVESVYLARQISASLGTAIGAQSPNRGLRPAQWFVVRNTKMPAVLVEVGFVTNLEEARLLADSAYLLKLAQGLYTGITSFIDYFENQQRKSF